MTEAVSADDLVQHIERYRHQAQTEPVPISVDGQVAGYFISPDDYEVLRHRAGRRTSFATEELAEDLLEAIANSQMDARHSHLDAMLAPD